MLWDLSEKHAAAAAAGAASLLTWCSLIAWMLRSLQSRLERDLSLLLMWKESSPIGRNTKNSWAQADLRKKTKQVFTMECSWTALREWMWGRMRIVPACVISRDSAALPTSILPRRIHLKINKYQQKCFYCFLSLLVMKTIPLKKSNILPYDFCSHNTEMEKTWKHNWLLLIFPISREKTCQWEREQKSHWVNLEFKLPPVINSNHPNIYFFFYGFFLLKLISRSLIWYSVIIT